MTEPFIFGDPDKNTLDQIHDVATRAERAALMADGHVGYVMPIGGVAAFENQVSVVGVGFDIACGNAAIRTDRYASEFDRAQLKALADEIQATLSFGIGRNNLCKDAPVDSPLFEDDRWSALPEHVARPLRNKARSQLGTVGSGNHYVDVFRDEEDRIWVGVHFGSRGFGHGVASGFLALYQGRKWGDRVPEIETLLSLDSEMGQAYWAMMTLAGEYAYAGREWVARKVVAIIGARELDLVHNHHNYAWKETHGGKDYIVVRKGATPAWPGQRGFVGGSMGDDSVILRGTEKPNIMAQEAMFSTVHGAGRVMSRTQAAGKRNWKTGKVKKTGQITWKMLHEWVDAKGVILRGGGLDESPHAYRRLKDVLRAQGSTIEVLHTLEPLIVVMAGEDEFDPYRD